MPFIEEKFEQERIDSLKRFLSREQDKGRKRDYEIIVDGFKIVSRTNDLEEFDDYESEIKGTTRNVSILIYDGPLTNRNTRYSFKMHESAPLTPVTESKPLNGPEDIQRIVQEKLDARDREHELNQLREKLSDTEQQLEESEEYAKGLEEKIRELEAGQIKKMIGFSDLAGSLLGGVLKQNPQILHNLPVGGEALAGLLAMPATPDSNNSGGEATETAATFEKKQQTQEDKDWQQYRKQMESSFSPQQLLSVFEIISKLGEEPERIKEVTQLLNIQNK